MIVLAFDYLQPLPIAIALMFSGEEQYGKYLDLYANHTTYNNLKNIGKRLGYLQYLDVLLAAQSTSVHSELPKDCRLSRDYELYVHNLAPLTLPLNLSFTDTLKLYTPIWSPLRSVPSPLLM